MDSHTMRYQRAITANPPRDAAGPAPHHTVTISQSEYQRLVSMHLPPALKLTLKCRGRVLAQNVEAAACVSYGCRSIEPVERILSFWLPTDIAIVKLKESLLDGGLPPEMLDVLIDGDGPPLAKAQARDAGDTSTYECTNSDMAREALGHRSIGFKTNGLRPCRALGRFGEESHSSGAEVMEDDSITSSESVVSFPGQTPQRTLLLRDLPSQVTYRDIVKVLRGGCVLSIFLRQRDRIARVSFADESAAREFLQHARHHGVYVKGKRLDVSWNDRQAFVAPHIQSRVGNGATRNICISNVSPSMTEEMIRQDLEHIHNLVVISVRFDQGNAYISTNSVHNALFARSCMMSRVTYKGMRIGFYGDECAQPLPKVPVGPAALSRRVSNPTASFVVEDQNRFHVLSVDPSGDEENENSPQNGKEDLRADGSFKFC